MFRGSTPHRSLLPQSARGNAQHTVWRMRACRFGEREPKGRDIQTNATGWLGFFSELPLGLASNRKSDRSKQRFGLLARRLNSILRPDFGSASARRCAPSESIIEFTSAVS